MDVEAQSDDVAASAGRSCTRALFDAVERYGFRGCALRRRGAGRDVVAVFCVVEVDAEGVGGEEGVQEGFEVVSVLVLVGAGVRPHSYTHTYCTL